MPSRSSLTRLVAHYRCQSRSICRPQSVTLLLRNDLWPPGVKDCICTHCTSHCIALHRINDVLSLTVYIHLDHGAGRGAAPHSGPTRATLHRPLVSSSTYDLCRRRDVTGSRRTMTTRDRRGRLHYTPAYIYTKLNLIAKRLRESGVGSQTDRQRAR